MAPSTSHSLAVAVYCASSLGNHKAYQLAAVSVGHALAKAQRPLVYGGGSKGIMGVVSGAALEKNGQVTGIIPFAMLAAGGEKEKTNGTGPLSSVKIALNGKGRERVETVVVDTMHERKVEMAKRAGAFIGLPGGFGTFEEVLEVTTWTQLGIHQKPVILINVFSFWDPLRDLIQSGIREGFIQPQNESLIIFVDGPADHNAHETFDWGKAALEVLDNWKSDGHQTYSYDWSKNANGMVTEGRLAVV